MQISSHRKPENAIFVNEKKPASKRGKKSEGMLWLQCVL